MSAELKVTNLQGVLSASETVQAMLAQGQVIINDWVITTEAIAGGYRLIARRGTEEQTLDVLDGVKGDKGDRGDAGADGCEIFVGNLITGTNIVEVSDDFVDEIKYGDLYFNNETGNVYRVLYSISIWGGESGLAWHCMGNLIGPAGYTPVRGTDYWTEEDKAEIKSYVDDAILGGSW